MLVLKMWWGEMKLKLFSLERNETCLAGRCLSVRLTSILNSCYTVSVTSASQPCEAMLNGILMRPSESPRTLLCAFTNVFLYFYVFALSSGKKWKRNKWLEWLTELGIVFFSLLFIYLFSYYVHCLLFSHLLPYDSVQLNSIFRYLNSYFLNSM
jgi:hypothetical protein